MANVGPGFRMCSLSLLTARLSFLGLLTARLSFLGLLTARLSFLGLLTARLSALGLLTARLCDTHFLSLNDLNARLCPIQCVQAVRPDSAPTH